MNCISLLLLGIDRCCNFKIYPCKKYIGKFIQEKIKIPALVRLNCKCDIVFRGKKMIGLIFDDCNINCCKKKIPVEMSRPNVYKTIIHKI